jgi:hypothetical protein
MHAFLFYTLSGNSVKEPGPLSKLTQQKPLRLLSL